MTLLASSWLSPQRKLPATLLFLGILLAAAVSFLFQHYLLPAVKCYERDLAASSVARIEQAIDGHLDALVMFNGEYAAWDDTYQYVLSPAANATYIEDNMYEEYWAPIGIELVLFLDGDGQQLWGMLTEAGGEHSLTLNDVVLPLFTNNPLLSSHASVHSQTRGLIDTPAGLMLIVSIPITRTDGSGPVVGSFLTGRLLNEIQIENIAKSADVGVRLHFLSDQSLPAEIRSVPVELEEAGGDFLMRREGDQEYSLSLLRDLYGDPAAVVEVHSGRRVFGAGVELVESLLTLILLGIAAFVLLSWLLLRGSVGAGRDSP
jgi:sensor domain CHASE-containing protein